MSDRCVNRIRPEMAFEDPDDTGEPRRCGRIPVVHAGYCARCLDIETRDARATYERARNATGVAYERLMKLSAPDAPAGAAADPAVAQLDQEATAFFQGEKTGSDFVAMLAGAFTSLFSLNQDCPWHGERTQLLLRQLVADEAFYRRFVRLLASAANEDRMKAALAYLDARWDKVLETHALAVAVHAAEARGGES